MFANGSQIATQGIILNEISGDVEFTFELNGKLTETETLKSGALRLKAASSVAAGPPLAFAHVYLIDVDTEEVLFQTQTDENGFFEFSSIPYKNYYFAVNEPVLPAEPLLLTFESNIFIKEVEINGEVGTEGITASVSVTPNNNCDTESPNYTIWYLDYDGDGFGTSNFWVGQCTQPIGYVLNDLDCNDKNADINPDATDIQGVPIDYDCDGEIPCNSFELVEFSAPTVPVIITDQIGISVFYNGDLPSTAEIDWGDGSSSPATISIGVLSGTHLYAEPGVYILTLVLTDGCQETRTFQYKYVVLYDPSEGFVTGSGTIYSPTGASTLFPNADGIASFGFVSKYDKKKGVPIGNTEFEFEAGELLFASTEYDWLVVAGSKAKFKGRGSVNGVPGYQFMISAIDAETKGNPDLFRIKIWNETTGYVVYDNQMDAELNADPTTAIMEGSIRIHTPKTKSELITSSNISELSEDKFLAYPNPTKGKITVKIGHPEKGSVFLSVTNITGQILLNKIINYNESIEIDLSSKPAGVYLLNIKLNDKKYVKKIILKHE
jgi:hypothetical protein